MHRFFLASLLQGWSSSLGNTSQAGEGVAQRLFLAYNKRIRSFNMQQRDSCLMGSFVKVHRKNTNAQIGESKTMVLLTVYFCCSSQSVCLWLLFGQGHYKPMIGGASLDKFGHPAWGRLITSPVAYMPMWFFFWNPRIWPGAGQRTGGNVFLIIFGIWLPHIIIITRPLLASTTTDDIRHVSVALKRGQRDTFAVPFILTILQHKKKSIGAHLNGTMKQLEEVLLFFLWQLSNICTWGQASA